ncbi:endonuclease [Sulfurimonas diazotrophicus]|uniref:Endonuclease n=1 Tax=Sulfurimonas diazotrophicus TaxID=3131939 RepID=A0ABZ3H9P9_9BACT
MKKQLLLLIVPVILIASPSFNQSKRLLKDIYSNHQTTFYCGCDYTYANKGNMIDRASCGYSPRNPKTKKGKDNMRARRIEWEHIMPAENFGRHLPCWKEGGRKHCRKVSEKFREMEADMMNLVPAIGELNGDRSNYRYGALEPHVGQYGECRFEVDFKGRRAMVSPNIRGDIARVYLYMSKRYGIPLSKQERKMMEVWAKEDPESAWEREKLKRLRKLND